MNRLFVAAFVVALMFSCSRAPEGSTVVHLKTDDQVDLEADLLVHPGASPVVILFHMVPPSNSRSNFKASFIEALAAKGFTVLNVDRRGAGHSGGVALEAYEGPKGELDAKAAVDFISSLDSGADRSRIAFIGASNGTATVLDYVSVDERKPSAVVFLTGGDYTEAQHIVRNNKALMAVPTLFAYADDEHQWSAIQEAHSSPLWEFAAYPSGHGTHLLGDSPASTARVVEFLAAHLK